MLDLNALDLYPVVCQDTETTGLHWWSDRMFAVALSAPACSLEQLIADPLGAPLISKYVDLRFHRNLLPILRDKAPYIRRYVNHNAKFDAHFLQNEGIHVPLDRTECTTIRACLIDEHLLTYDLDSLAKRYLKMGKKKDVYEALAEMFGGKPTKQAQMKNLHRAPPELVGPYAIQDSEVALRLWAWQEREISKQDLGEVWALEKRLFPRVYKMERHGIRVDTELAERKVGALTKVIDKAQAELNKTAGFEVNPNPSGSIKRLFDPRQVEGGDGRMHWEALDGTRLDTTDSGNPSLGAGALERIKHPAAKQILRLRKLIKARDTFLRGHILGHEHNGRVHPNINQTKGESGGTGPGRLSYTGPALQQIPARDKEIAEMVREVFLPDKGHGWTYGDLDQHELRIFHHYVNNPTVVQAYRDNPDLDGHQIVADLTGLPRNATKSGGANAKQLNLAMVFCMGSGELADRMGLPFTWESFKGRGGEVHEYKKAGPEGEDIIDKYHSMVPGVREIAKRARTIAKTRGYVKTIFGRHLRFPGGMFLHKASGLVYQGSAADLVKFDLCNVWDYIDSEIPEANLLLSIHDEQNISIPLDSDWRRHMKNIKDVIQDKPMLRLPIRCDFSVPSPNWWASTQAELCTK